MTDRTIAETRSRDMSLHLALPKGRMQEGVFALLSDAGIRITTTSRGYRPRVNLPNFETKIPQAAEHRRNAGRRHARRGLRRRRLGRGVGRGPRRSPRHRNSIPCASSRAAPIGVLVNGKLPDRSLVIASEYETLTRRWIERRARADKFVRSYGATEVFPPEDADCIVDVTATGSTLEANRLAIVEELMTSSTRLYASRRASDDPGKRRAIDDLAMVLRSVLQARKRVMLELNVTSARLKEVCAALPCMRAPTISPLAGDGSFAVKAAVPRESLPTLIPRLKSLGGSDIIISPLAQVVP
jgi:ATP phosphoribosyltransferase-like protein